MSIPQPSVRATALVTILAAISLPATAQCPFDPTIIPDNLILCPNAQDSLTTQVYDAYQWYKEGEPIAGETGSTLTVDAFNDAAYHFSVEVTLEGCTEMSPEVLVDGWAFLPMTVMTSENYLFIDAGTAVFCRGDTGYLVVGLPYDTNIQWTNNGEMIPGATDDTLQITETGNYHVSGAPSLCPNYQQQLFDVIPISFQEPVQPVIMMGDASMCAAPTGVSYQWYLDGAPIAGDEQCIVPTATGAYTVDVTYDPNCSIPSDPFIITGIDEAPGANAPLISPTPALDHFTVQAGDVQGIGAWFLLDASGRVVRKGDGLGRASVSVSTEQLEAGTYWLRTEGRSVSPVSIVH